MNRLLKSLSWLIMPITGPMWLIEGAYRKATSKSRQFNVFTGGIYAFLLISIALLMLFSSALALRVVSLYVFTTLELIGIIACTTVVVGNRRGYKSILRQLARRKPYVGREEPLDVSDLWVAITSYLYTAFYFAIIGYFIYFLDNAAYAGVRGQTACELLFDFTYSSYVSMATLGYAEITPASIPSKLAYMAEITLGLLFTLVIFSLLANIVISRRSGDQT